MAVASKGKSGRLHLKAPSSAAINHPMRVRILEVANEEDVSPVQFIRRGMAPSRSLEGLTDQAKISLVAYHFRELEKYGCIHIADEHQRRGATEHIYRGTARAFFSDEDWAQLTYPQRKCISRTMLQGLFARAESAFMAGTFDKRVDRHLTWIAMELDDRGWNELAAIQAEAFRRAERVRAEARDRIESSGSESVQATFGALAFESPVLEPPR